jgi:hypothetical protein
MVLLIDGLSSVYDLHNAFFVPQTKALHCLRELLLHVRPLLVYYVASNTR